MAEWKGILGKAAVVGTLGLLAFLYFYSNYGQVTPSAVVSEPVEEFPPGVDMHVHTTESDGDLTAEQQIEDAARLKIPQIWITDHDMIRDLPRVHELLAVAQKNGVTVGFGTIPLLLPTFFADSTRFLCPFQAWKSQFYGKARNIICWGTSRRHRGLVTVSATRWLRCKRRAPRYEAPPLAFQTHFIDNTCVCYIQVKSSRENRNNMLVEHLNSVLTDGKIRSRYFVSQQRAEAFHPFTVADVSSWAQKNAGLLEPTSLGRPHFLKYLVQVSCQLGMRSYSDSESLRLLSYCNHRL